ncbi:hypothetical protein IFM89_001318 [Coptis chinensis]|uniref:Uncharacterized protein n=1 Tax=Coptis chinensis TaxID=261450 RepID=A0A835GWN2_9MAGN|nr:hypothetical protein IFM89_001318 [Coptis chinensis]
MATSAFKSTTKRSSNSNSSSSQSSSRNNTNNNSSRLLRSRSLSRGPSPSRGRFVNTVRGSFGHFEAPPSSSSTTTTTTNNNNNQRRSRSVSRPHTNNNNNNNQRRSSVSVARYNHFSDSESDDIDHHTHNSSVNHRQTELSKSYDGYSSHSSALTDEEPRDTHAHKNGTERTIRAVYSQKKTEHPTSDGAQTGMYQVMREQLRHAVEDIRTEIEQGIVKSNHSVLAIDSCFQSQDSDVLQAVSVIRQNYTAKLEQSEKRKQDLLAEIVAEEQRGRELSKIVKELLPDPKNLTVQEKSSLGRKNNDRGWMSKCLTEDAERYIDDFLSNVEDTDISSFDGERSDASSTLGVKKPKDLILHYGESEAAGCSTRSTSLPVEMDGVVLPWLQWETSNDGSPLLCKSKEEVSQFPEDISYGSLLVIIFPNNCYYFSRGFFVCIDLEPMMGGERTACNGSNLFTTSRPSCSIEGGNLSVFTRDDINNRFGDCRSYISRSPARRPKESYFDMDEYLHIQRGEELVLEVWRQRKHISSGALALCSRSCLQL